MNVLDVGTFDIADFSRKFAISNVPTSKTFIKLSEHLVRVMKQTKKMHSLQLKIILTD